MSHIPLKPVGDLCQGTFESNLSCLCKLQREIGIISTRELFKEPGTEKLNLEPGSILQPLSVSPDNTSVSNASNIPI